MATYNCPMVKYAFIDSASPDSRIAGQASQNLIYKRDTALLLGFERVENNANLKHKAILSVKPHFYFASRNGAYTASSFGASDSDFTPQTVSFNSKPALDFEAALNCYLYPFPSGSSGWNLSSVFAPNGSAAEKSAAGASMLRAKTIWPKDIASATVTSNPSAVVKLTGDDFPYLEIEYGDELHGTPVPISPIGGYVNPHDVVRFSWSIENLNLFSCVAPFRQSQSIAPTLKWRRQGDTTWNNGTGRIGLNYVDLPADRLPSGIVEWTVSVADESGTIAESAISTFTTIDTTTYAIPSSPISTVEDGASPITLSWAANNNYGNAPGSSELQYSPDGGTNWVALATVEGASTEYTAAANTFPVGQVLWRVRAYNLDGVAGPWAEATFISFAAPTAPSVRTDAVPFATITWQSEGQEAYQLELDGALVATAFGYGRQHTLSTPLEDGSHVARVRVQNSYGLWSPWGETRFNVSNEPGGVISLDAAFNIDAALSWSSANLSTDFLIFRDGALIGHTTGDWFTDRFVLGSHSYYVINRLPSGNYSRSNTVQGKMCTRRQLIALLSGGEWLPLRYSERSMTQQSFTWQKTHSLRHIAGATFPLLELSPYEDLSGAYDAAFLCAQDAERFYRLRGQVVILKSKDGKVLIGAITSITSAVNTFYQAAQFTLEQIQWEDYVDDADG